MINIKRVCFSFIILSFCFLYAQKAFLEKRTDLKLNNKRIGFVEVLTPIELLKNDKKISSIKIRGFRLENYPQMIVRDMKRKELYVELENEDISNKSFKIIKKYEDEYGEIWHQVEGEFLIDSSDLAKDYKSLTQKAKKTYEQTCSMCHHLPSVTAYTVNQWPQQIESMMEQVSLELPIKNLIIKYLQHNAVDSK